MLQLANNMGIMPGTTICGLADGAAWPIKNALAKFRPEFEDYIRTHQDPSYEVTGLQEAIALGVTPERSNNTSLPILPGPRPRPAFHPTCLRTPMATIILNGLAQTIPDGSKINAIQAASRFGVDIPYYCWHPALSVVANCRMCEIEVGTKDPKTGEIKMLPKLVPGVPDPRQGGDGARDRQPQGQGAPADDHGVPPDQPPARLPRLRPGGRVRPAGLQLRVRPGQPPLRRAAGSSTPARRSRTRSS